MHHVFRLRALLALALAGSCTDTRTALPAATGEPLAWTDELIISRVMIDPTAVSDEQGEWIELANLSDAPVDLRGWKLLSGHDPGFVIPQSLMVGAGETVTLGRNGDSSTNGGVHVDLVYTGITLGNAGDWLSLHDPGGVTSDSVEWGHAPSGVPLEHRGERARQPRPATPIAQPRPAPGPKPAPIRPDSTAMSRSPRELVVRVLDIGQGDATLIQNGATTVLVDGGPKPEILGRQLDALGLNGTTIDAVILTHQHADHYQGLRELFATQRHITVRYFWENEDPSPNVTLGKLRDSIASRVQAGSLIYSDTDDPCANGTPVCTVTFKGGAKLHIIQPDPAGKGPNNRSVALKLVGPDSASFTMWIAGDAERQAIDWFLHSGFARSSGMHVDVLKADHHGSCNGVSDAYLDALHPSLAVVSLAAVNDYGHMHAQAKSMYARHGVAWYRTDQNGTITLRSAGTPGSHYTVSVERGTTGSDGPSDRRSTQQSCEGE